MGKLSKRERALINLLIVVIILAGGIFYVIQPLNDKIDSVESDIYDQEFAVQEMKNTISMSDSVNSEIEQAQSDLGQYQSRLKDYMTNPEISSMLSSLAQSNGLTPASLVLGNTAYTQTSAYDSSKELGTGASTLSTDTASSGSSSSAAADSTSSADTSSSTDTSASSSDTSDTTGTTETAAASDSGYVTRQYATLTVTGDSNALISFISAVAADDSMDIFTITSAYSSADNSIVYTIVVEIYMNAQNG